MQRDHVNRTSSRNTVKSVEITQWWMQSFFIALLMFFSARVRVLAEVVPDTIFFRNALSRPDILDNTVFGIDTNLHLAVSGKIER